MMVTLVSFGEKEVTQAHQRSHTNNRQPVTGHNDLTFREKWIALPDWQPGCQNFSISRSGISAVTALKGTVSWSCLKCLGMPCSM